MKLLDLLNDNISAEKDAGSEYRDMMEAVKAETSLSPEDKEFFLQNISMIEQQEINHKKILRLLRDYLNINNRVS